MAEFFVQAHSVEQVCEALAWVKKNQYLLNVLGAGSNVVLQEYLAGLTLTPLIAGLEKIKEDGELIQIRAGAGEDWHSVVLRCTQAGWFGLENLAYIPGKVGAAPIQNIGAYGVELANVFHSLEALKIGTGQIRTFSLADCAFSYRDSIFKRELRDQYIITSVTLNLSRQPTPILEYPGIRAYLEDKKLSPHPANVMDAVIAIRKAKLPDPAVVPNAGSFFKNPIVDGKQFTRLHDAFQDIVFFALEGDQYKIAAAWLIDSLGWKGRAWRDICVHSQHALVLTNCEKRNGNDILTFAEKIRSEVKQKFSIELDQEPRTLGDA